MDRRLIMWADQLIRNVAILRRNMYFSKTFKIPTKKITIIDNKHSSYITKTK